MAPFLSVIVPLYNDESVIIETYRRLTHVLDAISVTMKSTWLTTEMWIEHFVSQSSCVKKLGD
jgi:hypothetical protein